MDKRLEENLLRWGIRLLVLVFGILLLLKFILSFVIPGLIPAAFFLIWTAQWRLFYIRGVFPGKIYTLIYALVALVSLMSAIRQFTT